MTDELNLMLNKLAKWRTVFAGWQLGTRAKGDPESDAVRDHRELTIMLRAEVTALTALMIDKGVFTAAEFQDQLYIEAHQLDLEFERKFPGFKTNKDGLVIDPLKAKETTKGWLP